MSDEICRGDAVSCSSQTFIQGLKDLRESVDGISKEVLDIRLEMSKVSRSELLDSMKDIATSISGLKIDVAVLNTKLSKTEDMEVRLKGLETKDNVLTGKLTVIGTVGTMFIAAVVSALVSFLNPSSATAAKETSQINKQPAVVNMKGVQPEAAVMQASTP